MLFMQRPSPLNFTVIPRQLSLIKLLSYSIIPRQPSTFASRFEKSSMCGIHSSFPLPSDDSSSIFSLILLCITKQSLLSLFHSYESPIYNITAKIIIELNGDGFMKKASIIFKAAAFAFLLFVCAFFFLLFPKQTAESVSEVLELCLKTVIPSLFPFMVLSGIFTSSVFCEKLSKILGKATKAVFGLNPFCSSAILISAVGGYPLGAFTARKLFERGEISSDDFKRLLLFAVLPSPSFAVGAVGSSMLGSKNAGYLIYFSVLLASLVLGVFSRLAEFKNTENAFSSKPLSCKRGVLASISSSIEKSGRSMLFICFSVLFFSAVLSVTDSFFPSPSAQTLCAALLEVTCGCKRLCKGFSLPVIAGAVGWGGLCTHFQIINEVTLSGLNASVFLAFRLLHGALSSVICLALLRIFPIASETFSSFAAQSVSFSSGSSLAFSLCLIAMSVLLLLGNNFVVNGQKTSDKIT